MNERRIGPEATQSYKQELLRSERSKNTYEKYVRDVNTFLDFLSDKSVTKEIVLAYKQSLEGKYAVTSINSMLAALNGFFVFLGWSDLKVKQLKTQRKAFANIDKELTRKDYDKLIAAAAKMNNDRLGLIIQTLVNTGIRISELSYFTVKSVKQKRIEVNCKGKCRVIFLLPKLKDMLLQYAESHGITDGHIFITKNGRPVDRSNIWSELKTLCKYAGVPASRVFPHNFRHFFARCFDEIHKDLGKLADILGHSSIETTRLYRMTSGKEHEKQMASLKLLIPWQMCCTT